MHRIAHSGIRRLAAPSSSSLAPRLQSYATTATKTFHSKPSTSSQRPTALWFLGAGVVFTGASLVLQSPTLGLGNHRDVIYNDAPSSGGMVAGWGQAVGRLLGKKPPMVEQKDIVLDNDLTVTSWRQQEQSALIKVPGVMLWGNNKSGLVDPSGKSAGVIQIPQRMLAFEGKVLRDLKLGDDVAVAVDETGNVYQWGAGYNQEAHQPEITLVNRDISQVTICDSKLYAVSKDGTSVYVLPKVRPTSGPTKAAVDFQPSKTGGSVWRYVGLGGSPQQDSMTRLPLDEILQKDETIASIASGKNHMLMVTSFGRVLGSDDGLSVSAIGMGEFRQSKIVQVACGEVHSLARDNLGRCWAWGLNGFGQLAQGAYSHSNLKLSQPTLIKDIQGSAVQSVTGEIESGCVKLAAGGQTSYFVIKEKDRYKVKSAGMGQWGQLGDGSYTHIQGSLVTIAPLSNLAEYKEDEKAMRAIGIHDLAIGSTHGFAVLDNAVTKDASSKADERDVVIHGRDVLSWGQNTYYQLLTGKRTNKTEPVHALPLDSEVLQPAAAAVAAIAEGKTSKAANSLDATNRLQLMPAQEKQAVVVGAKDKKGNVKKAKGEVVQEDVVELRIVAGTGVSGVFCAGLLHA